MESTISLTQRQLIILMGIRDGKTIEVLANETGVSNRTVQVELDKLEKHQMLVNQKGPKGGGLHRGRKLTDIAYQYLEDVGQSKDV